MQSKNSIQVLLILALVTSIMQSAQGYSNQGFHSFFVGFFVFFITSVLLFIRLAKHHELSKIYNVLRIKSVTAHLVQIASFCTLANFLSSNGYKYGNPQTGIFLLKADIFLVSIGSVLLYKERFSKRDIICSLGMFAGVLLILDVDFAAMTFGFGDLFFVLSALTVSINAFSIVAAQKQTKVVVDSYVVSYFNATVGAIIFFVAMLVSGQFQTVAQNFTQTNFMAAVVIAGVFQYFYFVIYYSTLRVLPVWYIKATQLVVPVIVMVIAFFLYHTVPSTTALLGGTIVIVSGYGLLQRQKQA